LHTIGSFIDSNLFHLNMLFWCFDKYFRKVHISNVYAICILNSHIYNQQQSLRKVQLSLLICSFFLLNNFFRKYVSHGFVTSFHKNSVETSFHNLICSLKYVSSCYIQSTDLYASCPWKEKVYLHFVISRSIMWSRCVN